MKQYAWVGTAVLASAVVVVMGGAWALMAPEAFPDAQPAPQTQDSGREMDLEHLTEEDLVFLETVLAQEGEAARSSAARALLVAGDPRGAPILLTQAGPESTRDMEFCLAAMDILRMQRHDTAARTLIMVQGSSLSMDCQEEVEGRLSLLAQDARAVGTLTQAPETEVRLWATRRLSWEDASQSALLAELAQDPELEVRRVAWQLIDAGGMPLQSEALLEWAGQEPDAQLHALIQEVVSEW